ncbi:hypothetical protein Hdeb2414_s0033g00724841 [Helianthus debilis subsp. tardiflorus]
MILVIVETTIASMIVFFNRHTFGYIFTNEKEVVEYVTKITPLLCVNIMMDSLQGNFAGNIRMFFFFFFFFCLTTRAHTIQ